GGDDPCAKAIISAEASAKHAPFTVTERSSLVIRRSDLFGNLIDYRGYEELSVPLAGLYQARNAATVITALALLEEAGLRITEETLRKGLLKTVWRARFEVLSKRPLFVFDGSHNAQGVAAASESIAAYFDSKVLLLTGVMADKAYESMAEMLAPQIHEVFTVTPDNPRALDADALAAVYRRAGVPAKAYATVAEGVYAAFLSAASEGLPIVALGSLYMYGEVKTALMKLLRDYPLS
ncbi:MAG: bifunctional folylpolyglutamate synthase/dihydrofolate synthase, partial [Clostridia bacterium]|nr:bifunctional folylpolyglutamate synthase/dihydrofolate synthase [Clostridia bacterium]